MEKLVLGAFSEFLKWDMVGVTITDILYLQEELPRAQRERKKIMEPNRKPDLPMTPSSIQEQKPVLPEPKEATKDYPVHHDQDDQKEKMMNIQCSEKLKSEKEQEVNIQSEQDNLQTDENDKHDATERIESKNTAEPAEPVIDHDSANPVQENTIHAIDENINDASNQAINSTSPFKENNGNSLAENDESMKNESIEKQKAPDYSGGMDSNAQDSQKSEAAEKISAFKTDSYKDHQKKASKIFSHLANGKLCAGTMAAAAILGIFAVSSSAESFEKSEKIDELDSQIALLSQENADKTKQIQSLEEQIDELQNGPSRKLEIIQAKFNEKDWEGTLAEANALHEDYPGTEADVKGQELMQKAQSEIEKAKEAKRKEEERKKQEEAKRKEEEARKKAEEEARGYETGITYDALARYPDDNFGQKVKFSGEVIQVMNEGDSVTIRLAVDQNYDTVLLATFNKDAMTKGNILEDDIITIYGTSMGDYTYESTFGQMIIVPLISVAKIDQ